MSTKSLQVNFNGEMLDALLTEKGITRPDLSEALGLNRTFMTKTIGSYGHMTKSVYFAMCQYLQISRELLLTDTPQPHIIQPKKVVKTANALVTEEALHAIYHKLDLMTTQNEEIIGLLSALHVAWVGEMDNHRTGGDA